MVGPPGWVEELGLPLPGVEAWPGPVPVEAEGVDAGVLVDGDGVLVGVDWLGFWPGLVVLGFWPGVVVRVPVLGSVVLRGDVRSPGVVPGVLPGVERSPGVVFPGVVRGVVPSPGVVLPGVR